MNTTGHHSAVYKIEIVGRKGRSVLPSVCVASESLPAEDISRAVEIVYLEFQVFRGIFWNIVRETVNSDNLEAKWLAQLRPEHSLIFINSDLRRLVFLQHGRLQSEFCQASLRSIMQRAGY